MELEKQVCSLDLAKRLNELGATQESYFWWYEHSEPEWEGATETFVGHQVENAAPLFAAFTSAELGEMLPQFVAIYGNDLPFFSRRQDKTNGGWGCGYRWDSFMGWADTEADARAKMLIYLIENKLIEHAAL